MDTSNLILINELDYTIEDNINTYKCILDNNVNSIKYRIVQDNPTNIKISYDNKRFYNITKNEVSDNIYLKNKMTELYYECISESTQVVKKYKIIFYKKSDNANLKSVVITDLNTKQVLFDSNKTFLNHNDDFIQNIYVRQSNKIYVRIEKSDSKATLLNISGFIILNNNVTDYSISCQSENGNIKKYNFKFIK